jgi:hypothetical protein
LVQIVETGSDKIVGTRVSAQIDAEDFDEIQALVSKKIKKFKNISWYYELADFEGWELNLFWRDIVFSLMNTEHFRKIAFVGENAPKPVKEEVTSVYTPAKVKYFDIKDKKSALEWVLN